MLLGEQDGEETYRRLRDRIARGGRLTPEDRLDLIFLPLMRHERPQREVVVETVALARRLPERQQRQAVASLIGLGSRFLSETDLDTLLEGLMSTNLGQQLIERGREQGLEQGRQRERAQAVLDALTYRFGPLPVSVGERLTHIDDLQRLRDLSRTAVIVNSVEEFTRALE